MPSFPPVKQTNKHTNTHTQTHTHLQTHTQSSGVDVYRSCSRNPAAPAAFIPTDRWTTSFGTSKDISSHRKPSAVKTYCGIKPTVGCVRKSGLQASWFMELGLRAISHGHWAVTVIVIIISDFSVPSVVVRGGSVPVLKLVLWY